MPAHGRVELAKICMTQLRRTCDLLEREGVIATAVVIADDENLDTARSLGFGTVERNNRFLARKYNDGIQFALDPEFNARPASYVVPIGSDDWVDHRLFLNLPPRDAVLGFRQVAFVAEDAQSLTETTLRYEAGVGIRVYPRALLEPSRFRPADEDRKRACDTSILWNTRRNYRSKLQRDIRVVYGDIHPLQIVDWKTTGTQMNGYRDVTGVHRGRRRERPFECLEGFYPAEALEAMEDHYRGGTMTSYRDRHLDGYHDADPKVRAKAEKAEKDRVKQEEKEGTKTASTTSADVAGLTK
jgi:hypothetical protein